ncbi:hypothetical protein C5F48_01625 [Cereibacter changlensis JA139]|uniref:Uncharacterized protein n=2 Tax=Cereibacter changlensis TaxID=402884 RepID=A0A2T4K0F9_9RHOB|nr:hypothetical protein [Cereibacter changlensis]PTE23567.1 hypothetical protein C5F48_01625 [Cereibacter changlensis JA139]PZX58514.1 hypothetical protein LX76_00014 [Cereibacter changlensis]
MGKIDLLVDETLLQRARSGRLRALRHLHRDGLALRNIFNVESEGGQPPERPTRDAPVEDPADRG